ncbi:MAG TPA: FGGY-family carbohydrate kinase [Anaerolineae bacterium]|nr:FGGY-family carbohydrate kinase [Anaerolineae bacterium]
MSLLGLDIGITGCKAVAFSPTGDMLAQAYREYKLYQPQPGWMELDPAEVWSAVGEVIGRAASAVTGDPVRAVSVSTHGESVVPVDAQGLPIYRFITAIDTRASEQARWWGEQLGRERIFQITGMPLHPMYTVNKLMWLRQYDPAVYNAAHRFLCMQDFVFHQMGLIPTMDRTLAVRTMAFDVSRLEWAGEILELAQLDVERLSRVWPSGQVIGEISPSVAEALGLAPGALGVSGAHDQPAGALGCGAITEGIAMDSTGTVECVAVPTPRLVLAAELMESNLPMAPYVLPDMYLVLGYSSTGGALLRWYRDNFAGEEWRQAERTGQDVYDLILQQATEGPSPVLILPHFVGAGTPSMDADSKGAILGLDLSTPKGQIIKAILDSVSYEVKLSIDAMEAAGIAVRELRAFGGGAKSPLWLQTKADVYGKPVVAMDVSEAPALGVALLAGVATGVFSSVEEGVAQMVRTGPTFEPDLALHQRYMEKFQVFKQVYPALAELNHQL